MSYPKDVPDEAIYDALAGGSQALRQLRLHGYTVQLARNPPRLVLESSVGSKLSCQRAERMAREHGAGIAARLCLESMRAPWGRARA